MKSIVITNNIKEAEVYKNAVSVIMVDLEREGKQKRQAGKNTWISDHTMDDARKLKTFLKGSSTELWVRCDFLLPTDKLKVHLEEIVDIGVDAIMVPMFEEWEDVHRIIKWLNNKVRVIPLIETKHALTTIDKYSVFENIDYIHFGLNDLSIQLKSDFLFDVLFDWRFILALEKLRHDGQMFGIGGLMPVGTGFIDSRELLKYHAYFGSKGFIVSRGFKESINNSSGLLIKELEVISRLLEDNKSIKGIGDLEELKEVLDQR
jgi:hypothetical protein